MRDVFIDANVIIDWLVAKSINHELCTQTIKIAFQMCRSVYISPTTIAITSYFLYKNYKSASKAKAIAQEIFEPFRITTENEAIVKQSLASNFIDLEDAIQYHSALDSNLDAIITQNGFDFRDAKLPIISPQEFCGLFSFGKAR